MVQAKSVFGFLRLFEKEVWGDCVEDRFGSSKKEKEGSDKMHGSTQYRFGGGKGGFGKVFGWILVGMEPRFLPSILEMACAFTRGSQGWMEGLGTEYTAFKLGPSILTQR